MRSISETMDETMKQVTDTVEPVPAPSDEALADAAESIAAAGWLPYDRAAFEALATYLAGRRRLGLLLTGPPGTGKTMALSAVLRLRIVRSREIVQAYEEAEGYNAEFWHRCYRVFDGEQQDGAVIDDLGEEPECVRYGQREEILSNVVAVRYVTWQRTGARTYVTTNLDARQIDARYGRRVLDRLREMCTPISLGGASNRRRKEA